MRSRKAFFVVSAVGACAMAMAGCATKPVAGSENVRLVTENERNSCELLGVFSVYDVGLRGMIDSVGQGAQNAARNKVHSMGGNAMRIIDIENETDKDKLRVHITAEAFRCPPPGSTAVVQHSAEVPPVSQQPAQPPTRAQIQEAQSKLNALGFTAGPADGLMGPRTEAAITAFQRDHQLEVTGTLNDQTMSILRSATSPQGSSAAAASQASTKQVRPQRSPSVADSEMTPASSVGTAVDEIELKASADPFAETLTTIQKGRRLEVLRNDGEWLFVRYNEHEGYVFSEFISNYP